MPDPHANFAVSTVATAPSPAASGTSLVVAAAEGTRFPDPASVGAYNCAIWPVGELPTPANAEIVRVTAKSTDTLTIARTQESTSARTVIVGDQIAIAITAKTLTDAEVRVVRKAAGESTSLMTFIDSADLTFAVLANTNYHFRFVIFFNTNAVGVGIRLAINGPAGATLKVGGFVSTGAGGQNDSTIAQGSGTTLDGAILATTTGPGGTNAVAIVEGTMLVAGTPGNLTLRHASETATATQIEAGSFGILTPF